MRTNEKKNKHMTLDDRIEIQEPISHSKCSTFATVAFTLRIYENRFDVIKSSYRQGYSG